MTPHDVHTLSDIHRQMESLATSMWLGMLLIVVAMLALYLFVLRR